MSVNLLNLHSSCWKSFFLQQNLSYIVVCSLRDIERKVKFRTQQKNLVGKKKLQRGPLLAKYIRLFSSFLLIQLVKIYPGKSFISYPYYHFLPKCKQKITRIFGLTNKQGSIVALFFGDFFVSRQFLWLWSLFVLVGRKSLYFLVCILGETVTSSIHPEFNWPFVRELKSSGHTKWHLVSKCSFRR